ncbi:Phage tail fiber protein [Pseudomonas chlororaphis]
MTDQNSQFFAILTAVGLAKQANADALGIPWTFAQMGVGDANGTDPIPGEQQTKLIHENRRAPLNQVKVDPNNANVIIAEQVIPENVGGWWIREIGLYDAAGDLVAVANCAPSFKPLLSQGSGRTQVIRMNLVVSNTANVELKIDPSVVLATRRLLEETIISVLPPNKAAGTYRQVTVNDRGVVQSGSNPTTLAGYGITDALAVGQYGLGSSATPNSAIDTIGLPGGFYTMGEGNTGLLQYSSILNLPYSNTGFSAQIAIEQGGTDVRIVVRAVNAQGGWTPVRTLWHNGNFNPATKADAAATEAALVAKAPLASPAFTGTPTVPTAAAGTNTTQAANTAFVKAAIAALVGSSPAALDTLNELATALGNDPNFATTMTNALAGKATKATTLAGYGITDGLKIGAYGLGGTTAPIQAVDTMGLPGGFYSMDGTTTTLLNYSSVLNFPYSSSGFSAQLALQQGASQVKIVARATTNSGAWTPTVELYHTGNTTRAADGTLKAI